MDETSYSSHDPLISYKLFKTLVLEIELELVKELAESLIDDPLHIFDNTKQFWPRMIGMTPCRELGTCYFYLLQSSPLEICQT